MQDAAIVALGANLPGRHGSPLATVEAAMRRLASLSVRPMTCSSLWRSTPVDCPPGSPDFINAVAVVYPDDRVAPDDLLVQLQRLEGEFGRERGAGRNAPRVLDLDLIAWGDRRCVSPKLQLPHPRAHERAFVLVPLAEVAPDLVLPGQHRPVSALAAACPDRAQIRPC